MSWGQPEIADICKEAFEKQDEFTQGNALTTGLNPPMWAVGERKALADAIVQEGYLASVNHPLLDMHSFHLELSIRRLFAPG